jgi:hypothetical protein
MLRDIDNYFLAKNEPVQSCLLFLRSYISSFDENITEEWKYRMPFYYYKGRMLCYLWTDKKTGLPYVGIADGNKINHPLLVTGDRARMKILRVNPDEDVQTCDIESILKQAIAVLQ